MHTEQKSLDDIRPYQKNAKIHGVRQIEQIAASISNFGFLQPIVVDEAGVIVVGHGRYLAAQTLGLDSVPVLTVKLSPEQVKAYRLADNKLNESDWNMDLVLPELKEMSLPNLELTGFDKKLLDPIPPEPPEEAPRGEKSAVPKCTVCGEKVMCESCDDGNL